MGSRGEQQAAVQRDRSTARTLPSAAAHSQEHLAGIPSFPGPGTRLGTCGFVSGRVDPLWPGVSTAHRPVDPRLDGGASLIYSALRETRRDVDDLAARLALLEARAPERWPPPPRAPPPTLPAPAPAPPPPRPAAAVPAPMHLPAPSTPILWQPAVVPSPETLAAVARWTETLGTANTDESGGDACREPAG